MNRFEQYQKMIDDHEFKVREKRVIHLGQPFRTWDPDWQSERGPVNFGPYSIGESVGLWGYRWDEVPNCPKNWWMVA